MFNKNIAISFRPSVFFNNVSGGTHWLASVLRMHDIPFYFYDESYFVNTRDKVGTDWERLDRRNVKIFAIPFYSRLFLDIYSAIQVARIMMPDVWIVCGGPAVNTGDLGKLAELMPEVDCFIKGDSEIAFLRVAKILLKARRDARLTAKQKRSILKMKGMFFRHGDFVHRDDNVNVISRNTMNRVQLDWEIEQLRKDIISQKVLRISTRRGCRYSCIFCSHKYTKKSRAWSAKRIIKELKRIKLLIESGVLPEQARYISFDDDDFFQNPMRAKKFLKMVQEDNQLNEYFGFQFQGSVPSFFKRNGSVDEGLIELFSGLSMASISLGTDGFCDEELRVLRKYRYRYSDIEQLVKMFERYGVINAHYLILITNHTTLKTLRETLAQIKYLLVKYSHFFLSNVNYNLMIYPGSTLGKLFEKGKAKGTVKYKHRLRGEYFGDVFPDDPVVMQFLRVIMNTEYNLSDDMERLVLKWSKMDPNSNEHEIYSRMINGIERCIPKGTYKVVDFQEIKIPALSLFIIDKMLDILDDLEGIRPTARRQLKAA